MAAAGTLTTRYLSNYRTAPMLKPKYTKLDADLRTYHVHGETLRALRTRLTAPSENGREGDGA